MTGSVWADRIAPYLHWLDRSSSECRARREGQNSHARRIVIIDDDRDVRALLCECLSALGFEVTQAENGHTGLARIAFHTWRNSIHGILLDLHMPVLSGMAVLQELRERHTELPVIVMSDADDIGALREAIRLGAREYLLKPFDHELLKQKCLRLFRSQD